MLTQISRCTMLDREHEILPGVRWGSPEILFTPAYWFTRFWDGEPVLRERVLRLGTTFREEVVACLLGGYGIPAEVGLAAFERIRELNLNRQRLEAQEIAETLREPVIVRGKPVLYRFWVQKSAYISAAMNRLNQVPPPEDSPIDLRSYLLEIPGIGPKTASWIVRNWTHSSQVAILDIHVVRAGILMGLYSPADDVTKHYFRMETRFLDLCEAMGLPAARLDGLIWECMRSTPRIVSRALSLCVRERSHAAD